MVEFVTNRQTILGKDAILELPNVLKWHGKNNVFLVVYSIQAEACKTIIKNLEENQIKYTIYDAVKSEPDLEVIDNAVNICLGNNCDSVVALGGGSVIDSAKTIAMIATNEGVTEDYQLNGRPVVAHPLLFVAIPTTAGTGAEATKVSVVYNRKKGFKKALYHNSMIAQTAILDPNVTMDLPPHITAATGMDAITHAIESYTGIAANDFSRMYSLRALEILSKNIVTAYEEPKNIDARQAMLLGSYFAGCAISAGTALAHIVGQPVGAIYSIPHGDVCSVFLIPSMKLNKEYALEDYIDIAKTLGVDTKGKTDNQIFDEGIAILEEISGKINAPCSLKPYISQDKFDMEAVLDNIELSMGHIKNNPRPISRELFREIISGVLY